MNSSRKLKRNQMRKVVGNKGLRNAWKEDKLKALLAERKDVLKARKKAMKKKAMEKNPEEKRRLSFKKLSIDRALTALGYNFEHKRLMV